MIFSDIFHKTISSKLVYEKIFDIFDTQTPYDVTIRFNNHAKLGMGITFVSLSSKTIHVTIDTQGLINPIYNMNNVTDIIKMSDYVYLLTTTFHERRHVQQEIDFLVKDDNETKILAISKLFSWYKYDYYKSTWNQCLHEIDAERHAYLDTHQLLSNKYGKRNADVLMLQCIKKRQEQVQMLSKTYNTYHEYVSAMEYLYITHLHSTKKLGLSKFSKQDSLSEMLKKKKLLVMHDYREIDNMYE